MPRIRIVQLQIWLIGPENWFQWVFHQFNDTVVLSDNTGTQIDSYHFSYSPFSWWTMKSCRTLVTVLFFWAFFQLALLTALSAMRVEYISPTLIQQKHSIKQVSVRLTIKLPAKIIMWKGSYLLKRFGCFVVVLGLFVYLLVWFCVWDFWGGCLVGFGGGFLSFLIFGF